MIDDDLVRKLLDAYVWHKDELVRLAGGKVRLDRDRLRSMSQDRIVKMAEVIGDWDIKPDVVMDAVFAWARRNKHPDGPMPNMLYSVKYLTSAISNYLQVPYEVVMERRGMSSFLERMDFEFERIRSELNGAGVTDLVTATSYPLEIRYLMAVMKLDWNSTFMMSQELLEVMSGDRRVKLWLAHRGVLHATVAERFNKRKKIYGHH